MPRYYPGWTMRVYFDLEPDDPIMSDLCDLACHSDILDLCHAGDLPGTPMKDARLVFPMNWRFFPTLDPQVRSPIFSLLREFLQSARVTKPRVFVQINFFRHFFHSPANSSNYRTSLYSKKRIFFVFPISPRFSYFPLRLTNSSNYRTSLYSKK